MTSDEKQAGKPRRRSKRTTKGDDCTLRTRYVVTEPGGSEHEVDEATGKAALHAYIDTLPVDHILREFRFRVSLAAVCRMPEEERRQYITDENLL